MGCHNHLPVWALGPWKHRYSCSWDLHLNLLPFTWPCYTASYPTNKNHAYQQSQQRGPNWVKKGTFLHVCIQHINWLLFSFVPLLCPPTISVQAAVVTPRKKKYSCAKWDFYVWVFKYPREANFYPLLIRMGTRPCEWCDQLPLSTPEQLLNIHVQLLLWWNNWFEQFEKAMMSNVRCD